MSDNQVIPEAAVEAAAQLLAEESPEDWSGDQWTNAKIHDSYREPWRDQARAILEAAAPHMLAGAWNRGLTAGVRCERGDMVSNPYVGRVRA